MIVHPQAAARLELAIVRDHRCRHAGSRSQPRHCGHLDVLVPPLELVASPPEPNGLQAAPGQVGLAGDVLVELRQTGGQSPLNRITRVVAFEVPAERGDGSLAFVEQRHEPGVVAHGERVFLREVHGLVVLSVVVRAPRAADDAAELQDVRESEVGIRPSHRAVWLLDGSADRTREPRRGRAAAVVAHGLLRAADHRRLVVCKKRQCHGSPFPSRTTKRRPPQKRTACFPRGSTVSIRSSISSFLHAAGLRLAGHTRKQRVYLPKAFLALRYHGNSSPV